MHGREPDGRRTDSDGRGADVALPEMPVPDDPSVVNFDERPELVRLAKPIRPAKLLEVLQLVGRRLVVVGHAHLEGDLREAGNGLRRDPGDRRDGQFDPGAGHVGHLIAQDDLVPLTFPRRAR